MRPHVLGLLLYASNEATGQLAYSLLKDSQTSAGRGTHTCNPKCQQHKQLPRTCALAQHKSSYHFVCQFFTDHLILSKDEVA